MGKPSKPGIPGKAPQPSADELFSGATIYAQPDPYTLSMSTLEEVRLVNTAWDSEGEIMNPQEYIDWVKADYIGRKVLSVHEEERIAKAAQEWQALEPRLWRLKPSTNPLTEPKDPTCK